MSEITTDAKLSDDVRQATTGSDVSSNSKKDGPSPDSNTNVDREQPYANANHPNQKIKDPVQAMVEQRESLKRAWTDSVLAPFNVLTPEQKIKKRPDGFDYVEASYMDHQFKSHSPLYATKLEHLSIHEDYVLSVVQLTDRISGNSELGTDGALIMRRKSDGIIVDLGNNIKSSISKAVKNAQSKFGHAGDVYQRRESIPTEDEIEQFKILLEEIKVLDPGKVAAIEQRWNDLGTDFSIFNEGLTGYINKLKSSETNVRKKVNLT